MYQLWVVAVHASNLGTSPNENCTFSITVMLCKPFPLHPTYLPPPPPPNVTHLYTCHIWLFSVLFFWRVNIESYRLHTMSCILMQHTWLYAKFVVTNTGNKHLHKFLIRTSVGGGGGGGCRWIGKQCFPKQCSLPQYAKTRAMWLQFFVMAQPSPPPPMML